jgi:hypothetical protein
MARKSLPPSRTRRKDWLDEREARIKAMMGHIREHQKQAEHHMERADEFMERAQALKRTLLQQKRKRC